MTVPEEMRGVWRRRSIAVDGGSPQEPAFVLWLQASEAFADLRVPVADAGRVEAFAGVTRWKRPRLTWHHTIDWNGGFADYDCGEVAWLGDALVESGTFDDGGRTHSYEEVWDRVDAADQYFALVSETAIAVQVGTYSLVMRDGRGSASTFDVRAAHWSAEYGWCDIQVFGAGAELPLATEALDQSDWRLTESTPMPAPH